MPEVRFAPLGRLHVYEVSEAELDRLAAGPPGQLELSFALALLPAALTMLVTLQTVEIPDLRVYYGYWVAFWLFLVQGLIALFQWRAARSTSGNLIERIKARMPTPGVTSEPADPAPSAGG